MSNKKRWPEEAPTLSPTFDMESFARESERRIAQNGIETEPAPAAVASVTVPKASPTGFDFDPETEIGPSSVPVLLAVDATEVLSLPTESFLLGFVDGARDVDAIARASGIPRDLVMVTVTELARAGVLAIRGARY